MMKVIGGIIVLGLLLVGPATSQAASMCKTLTSTTTLDSTAAIGPIMKKRLHAGMQIYRTVGSGAVGSYTVQESSVITAVNSFNAVTYGWVDNGTAVTTVGLTKKTDVNAQFVRIKINALPTAGTTVIVCLYADGIDE